MMFCVQNKEMPSPPINQREIFRYAGIASDDERSKTLIEECLQETIGLIRYRVLSAEVSVSLKEDRIDLQGFSLKSASLAEYLSNSSRVILFAATIGAEFDRLLARYSYISPSKAVLLQAIGAERVEALCDAFCSEEAKKHSLKPRFSPGYGDLPLSAQKIFFDLLQPQKRIGLTCNDSFLMSPSKSVTAFVAVI